MAKKSNAKSRSADLTVQVPGHQLLTWEEAAAYLGPSFTDRWVKRQYYVFRTIRTVPVGGPAGGKPGKRMVPRAELDLLVERGLAQEEM